MIRRQINTPSPTIEGFVCRLENKESKRIGYKSKQESQRCGRVKITKVESFAVRWTASERYLGGRASAEETYYFRPGYRCVYSHQMEATFVKLTTDDGHIGWGECLSPVLPQVAAIIIREVFQPILLGASPHDVETLYDRMYDTMRDRGHDTGFMLDALAAVDIALWDLKSRALDCSIADLMGGTRTTEIPVYVSGIIAASDAERCEQAREWFNKGFTRFKLHQGFGIEADLDAFDAVRGGTGSTAAIALDGHWSYSFTEALTLGKELEARSAWFFEAPIDPENLRDHSRLAQRIDLPLAIGEGDRTRYKFHRIFEEGAATLAQPDLGRIGLTELKRIATLASAYHIPITLHASTGMGVLTAANLQAAAAIPNVICLEYQPLVFPLANSFLKTPLSCAKGVIPLPEGSGIGVEVDEEMVRSRTMDGEAEAARP